MDWLFKLFFGWAVERERARAEQERVKQAEIRAKSDALRAELEAAEKRRRPGPPS